MILVQVVFLLLSVVTLGGALGVVLARNVFHSALFLILSFFGVAGIYVLLEAPFLAAVQVFIYIGAVAVLILFAIMLTRQLGGLRVRQVNEQWGLAGFISLVLFVTLAFLFWGIEWQVAEGSTVTSSIADLGEALLTTYVLPFEVAAVLLLVSLVGAVIIARE
jgi:NADH-quinone oxidoreductase subunit J